jgi:hypothetical protein
MATFGPPSVAGTLNRLTDSIGNSIDNYRLGQELQNMPRAADGSPDYQAMSMRLMQINPQAARQMMAMEELRQRRAYQERSLANQERQTDLAADKSQVIEKDGKLFSFGPSGDLKWIRDVETGAVIQPGSQSASPQQVSPAPRSPVGAGIGKQPTPDHLQRLQSDPNLAPLFDEVYGPGSAQRYLAGGGPADPRQVAEVAPAPAPAPAPLPPLPPGLSYGERKEARKGQIKERVSVDQPELKKADDAVQSGRNTLQTIGEMLELNKRAFQGPLAAQRGHIASLTGIGGTKGGEDTVLLQNKITGGALEQLRSTFGGNPTEGERAILLQIQGSVGQSAAVREQIFKDAAALVRRRIKFNQKYAAAQRAGTYLNPEYTDNTPVD